MNIKSKYGLGDKVWKIKQNKPKIWQPCTFCGGTEKQTSHFDPHTKVVGLDGSERRCPDCLGRGGSHIYLELEWQVDLQLTIDRIEIRLSEDESREVYMSKTTGSPIGTLHYVDSLWPTKKEALAECARRNKENSNA